MTERLEDIETTLPECPTCRRQCGWRPRVQFGPQRKCAFASFSKKIAIDRETGCWMWTGAVSGNGYGSMRIDGKTGRAHAFSFRAFNGPILQGLHILHSCDRPTGVEAYGFGGIQ